MHDKFGSYEPQQCCHIRGSRCGYRDFEPSDSLFKVFYRIGRSSLDGGSAPELGSRTCFQRLVNFRFLGLKGRWDASAASSRCRCMQGSQKPTEKAVELSRGRKFFVHRGGKISSTITLRCIVPPLLLPLAASSPPAYRRASKPLTSS